MAAMEADEDERAAVAAAATAVSPGATLSEQVACVESLRIHRIRKRARSLQENGMDDGAPKDPLPPSPPPCDVCNKRERAYCCPRCGVKTCSLACCKAHKAQTGCTGRRDRFSQVPISQFTDEQLRSDYFFLEEVINSTQAAKRKLRKVGGGGADGAGGHNLQGRKRGRRWGGPAQQQQQQASPPLPSGLAAPGTSVLDGLAARAQRAMGLGEGQGWVLRYAPGLQRLVAEARQREVVLLLMPEGMTRRKQNTSRVANDGKKLLWRVEWLMVDAEPGLKSGQPPSSQEQQPQQPFRLVDAMHDEGRPLLPALLQHLEPRTGNAPVRQRLRAYCKRYHAFQQQQEASGASSHSPDDDDLDPPFLFFLEQQPRVASRPRYWRLDPRRPLGEGLKGKVIVEFPRIHVTLPAHAARFPLAIEEEPAAAVPVPASTTTEEEEEEEEEEDDDDSSTGSSGGDGMASEKGSESEKEDEGDGEPKLAQLTVNERLDVPEGGGAGADDALAALLRVYKDEDSDDDGE